ETAELLKKDCLDFRICKDDGGVNMNAFFNRLIANYYESFAAAEESLFDEVDQALFGVPEQYRKKVFGEMLHLIAKRSSATVGEKKSCTVSFKPTKVSEYAVSYIERVLLKNESLSSFYRRMFVSYSQKTKTEREKIIHREVYAALMRAIGKGVAVTLCLANEEMLENVSLFSVSAARDELFNYVLCYANKKNHTVRLAKIKTVLVLADHVPIPEKNQNLFEKQVLCGAQYPFYSTDEEPIRVRLTPKGKKLFEKIYLYRPTPVSVEGDIYTFVCSANQLLYYFERFGENALILSPKRLGIFMRNYYYYALKAYRTVYGKD
ncbi:MAG: hypothetical protein IJW46_07815, partial [Clostridia bacterium]|nr:hypothetical protein [Clostridia bacterium]